MRNGSYEFGLRVRGRTIVEYEGPDKSIWVEGREGSEYELYFKNFSSKKVKAVFSVDGLNVMNGKTEWTRGYVIDPYQVLVVPGWRRDSQEVASFFFSTVNRSYSYRIDAGVTNVGVVGCRVFEEKKYQYPDWWVGRWPYNGQPPKWDREVYTGSPVPRNGIVWTSTSAQPSMMASGSATVKNSVGTGWGENKAFKTKTVEFESNDTPAAEMAIFYDSAKGLAERGIYIRHKDRDGRPNPFPEDGCPIPR